MPALVAGIHVLLANHPAEARPSHWPDERVNRGFFPPSGDAAKIVHVPENFQLLTFNVVIFHQSERIVLPMFS